MCVCVCVCELNYCEVMPKSDLVEDVTEKVCDLVSIPILSTSLLARTQGHSEQGQSPTKDTVN